MIHLIKLCFEVFFKYLTDGYWSIKKSFYRTDPINLPKTRSTMKEKVLIRLKFLLLKARTQIPCVRHPVTHVLAPWLQSGSLKWVSEETSCAPHRTCRTAFIDMVLKSVLKSIASSPAYHRHSGSASWHPGWCTEQFVRKLLSDRSEECYSFDMSSKNTPTNSPPASCLCHYSGCLQAVNRLSY